jgi:hypothetical protein
MDGACWVVLGLAAVGLAAFFGAFIIGRRQ